MPFQTVARFRLAALLLASAAFIGCSGGSDSPTEPGGVAPPKLVAGVLSVRIQGIRADDRALFIRIAGVSSLTPVQLTQTRLTMHARVTGDVVSAGLFGEVGTGELVTVAVPNIAAITAYSVSLVEVADKRGLIRADTALATYTLSIGRN